jgi:hypothetical protein
MLEIEIYVHSRENDLFRAAPTNDASILVEYSSRSRNAPPRHDVVAEKRRR